MLLGGGLESLLGCLVAQMVKNLSGMQETWVRSLGRKDPQETWVRSLGRKDPLEKEMATPSCIFAGEFHGERILESYSPWGGKELDTTE